MHADASSGRPARWTTSGAGPGTGADGAHDRLPDGWRSGWHDGWPDGWHDPDRAPAPEDRFHLQAWHEFSIRWPHLWLAVSAFAMAVSAWLFVAHVAADDLGGALLPALAFAIFGRDIAAGRRRQEFDRVQRRGAGW